MVARQRVLRWDIGDLDEATAEAIAASRDDLDRRVLLLLADLLSAPNP
ncbi:hypothetical protein ACIBO5_52520 [Nonomuraea angiospora]|nr:hypothetical protein [Nonomuraea angiospora]MDX3109055.1 hypothetical protein [Nonomuraea angiospora]